VAGRNGAGREKRRLLLDAAVRVFARKGFHAARVGDVAEEAGVAYGLIYHYFASKDEVLETIFRDAWGALLEAIAAVEETEEDPREQLRKVVAIVLRTWRSDPDLVRVLVREITRSPAMQEQIGELGHAFDALQRIIERGQARGDFAAGLDARLSAYVVYGALEEILTGWVLGRLPDGDDDVTRAETTVVTMLDGGLVGSRDATIA
jgi:AcrR family transcriptional regulator